MSHVTPLRLIAVAVVLGILGGGFVGMTFALHGDAVFAAFLTGNVLLGLAALAGTLGVISLAVEIGVRAARRGMAVEIRGERGPELVNLPPAQRKDAHA